MPRIVLVTGCSTGGIGYSLFVHFIPHLIMNGSAAYRKKKKGVKNLPAKDVKSMQPQGRLRLLPTLVIGLLKRCLLMLPVTKVFGML